MTVAECACVYLRARLHVYACTRVRVSVRVCGVPAGACLHVCVCTRVRMYLRACVYPCVCLRVYLRACVCVCMRMSVQQMLVSSVRCCSGLMSVRLSGAVTWAPGRGPLARMDPQAVQSCLLSRYSSRFPCY